MHFSQNGTSAMVQYCLGTSELQEQLHLIDNEKSGLSDMIAIHSTALGPAAGGCRFWHYESNEGMTRDAARLAQGMSYKNALAGLPFGGGKALLNRPLGDFDRTALFRAYANSVAALEGRYITAKDVGTTIADMKTVRRRTSYVAGLQPKPGKAGLKTRIVYGSANNQLVTDKDGDTLLAREIVYAPDYLVNAWGIVNVTAEHLAETTEQVHNRVSQISRRQTTVLATAKLAKKSLHIVADEMAKQIITRTRLGQHNEDV
jgi:glutamate dehydrogenase/leucine dehydrogenase